VAAELNLVFQLSEDLRQIYLGFGIDLAKFNGDETWTLPVPARFVIDRAGIIRSADVGANYTVRPEPSDTIKILRSLTESSNL